MAVQQSPDDGPDSFQKESSLAVDDPDKYSQTRRLRTIHDLRDEVLNRRDTVFDAIEKRQISKNSGLRYYRRAIENFILEVEPLLLDEELETTARTFWESENLGTVVISPPPEMYQCLQQPNVQVAGGAQIPEPQKKAFLGLGSIRAADEPLQATFTVPLKIPHEPVQTKTWTSTSEIPLEILDKAFQVTNVFLRKIDVDTSLSSNDEEAKFDYSDLIPRGEGSGEEVAE